MKEMEKERDNFNWCKLNRMEAVAKEISPVSMKCDFCVTEFLILFSPVLNVFQSFL